jgi:hypothetical protein
VIEFVRYEVFDCLRLSRAIGELLIDFPIMLFVVVLLVHQFIQLHQSLDTFGVARMHASTAISPSMIILAS